MPLGGIKTCLMGLDQDGPEEISNELNPIYGERLREINRTNTSFKDTHGFVEFCKR